MRILYLTYYYFPHVGGGTWTTYHLVKNLRLLGNEVTLLTPNVRYAISSDEPPVTDVEQGVLRVPGYPLPRELAPILCLLFMLVGSNKILPRPDIIVAQHHPHHVVSALGVLLSKLWDIPCVLRADDVWRKGARPSGRGLSFQNLALGIFNRFLEVIARHADNTSVVCTEARDSLAARHGLRFDTRRISIIPNGFDPDFVPSLRNKDDARRLLGESLESRIILFVGRYSGQEYHLEDLLRAIRVLRSTVPQVLLVLMGDDPQRVKSAWGRILQDTPVRIFGPVPRSRVADWVSAADVCVGPLGPTQTVPLKVLEYLSAGKPTIVGKGSLSQDLAAYHALFRTIDPEEDSMADVIAAMIQQREGIELAAIRESFRRRYSWSTVALEMNGLLETVLTRSRMNAENVHRR